MCHTPSINGQCVASGAGAPGNLKSRKTFPDDSAQRLASIFEPHVSESTRIFFPSDEEFTEEVTQRWTTWERPSFVAAIKPATEEDVAAIVKLCSQNSIPFLATGGGHGAGTGYGTVRNALNIDLSNFRSVDLDAETNTLRVGGGTLAGQIYEPLYAAGKELPTGRSPCVGLVGLTLGGGIGTLQGKHGLVMDSLLSLRMVTAQGEFVTVSKTEEPDLFWAMRGAGANFGIVTSATYRVHDATNNGQFVSADYEFDGASSRSLWELLKSFDHEMPPELSVVLGCGYNRAKGQAILIANAVFSGTLEEAEPHLAGFARCNPTRSNVMTVPWPQLSAVAQFGSESMACNRNQFVNIYTAGLKDIDVGTLEEVFCSFISFYKEHPGYEGRFGFQKYSNQAVIATPASETVYPWRNIKTQMLFRNLQTDRTLDEEVEKLSQTIRSRLATTSGFDGLEAYINYAHGDETPEMLYGSFNLPKLMKLKAKWDPDNVFGRGCPVPLSGLKPSVSRTTE